MTPPFATYSSDGRRWATPLGMHTHSSNRVRETERRRLAQRDSPDVIPDWLDEPLILEKNKDEHNRWWVQTVSSLEEIHRHTFQSVLEDGLMTNAYIYAQSTTAAAGADNREKEKIAYNIRRFLREIDIRGSEIQKERLGRWKSSIIPSNNGIHNLVKSAMTAPLLTCGGGGGGGGSM